MIETAAFEILARTIYGEARGEPREAQEGVAAVVLNRVCHPATWWGRDVLSVCLWPYQFSCWNTGDPNRATILRARSNDEAFRQCQAVAAKALYGQVEDRTGGATHYHTAGITLPDWAGSMEQSAELGRLVFYRPKLAGHSHPQP